MEAVQVANKSIPLNENRFSQFVKGDPRHILFCTPSRRPKSVFRLVTYYRALLL